MDWGDNYIYMKQKLRLKTNNDKYYKEIHKNIKRLFYYKEVYFLEYMLLGFE